MSRVRISSRQNPLAQQARAVRDRADRARIFIEGVRLCEEALAADLSFEFAVFTESLTHDERGQRLIESLSLVCSRVLPVTESVLSSISDTKTSQGIIAIARRPETTRDVFENERGTPLIVVMHRANNPANAGAMIRVAEAAGATAAICTAGSTDPLSPKALRGSMGSAFRLPLMTGSNLDELFASCRAHGIRTVAAVAGARMLHTEFDWTESCAVVVGPEAGGLSDEEAALADERVSIPMRPPVESLNVATALAVLLYEAARRRRFEF